MKKAYIPAYLASLFPNLANLYEKITKTEIHYRNNVVIFSKFPKRKNLIVDARFHPSIEKMLEQKASS